jgi:gliding motility-associated-like protein
MPLINGNPLNIVNRVMLSSDEEDINPEDNTAEDTNQVNALFIPNVITPNNDGKNDRFIIRGSQKFAKREIVILNRFGDHLYENSNYDNDWSAEGIVGGTYFFVFRGTDSEGKVHEFKGWIQVIKK